MDFWNRLKMFSEIINNVSMKIVNFSPGLGNQIFEYIFTEYLKKKCPDEKVYGYYNPKFLNKHNGLEIHKIFEITLPVATKWSDFITFACRIIARMFPSVKATDKDYSDKAIYYDGWWQDKRFFLDTLDILKFRQTTMDETNEILVKQILDTDSVSIHVRRGDYLDSQNIKQYGGICTLDYYKKAIEIVEKNHNNPQYFVFSNDIEWCKANLPINNAIFVTNNTGSNSWKDMYLMSLCKTNIIANSSFSFWGALLNKMDNLVIYPEKWTNSKTPNIFPEKWIPISENGKKRA